MKPKNISLVSISALSGIVMSFFFRQMEHGDAIAYVYVFVASGMGIVLISVAALCLVLWRHGAKNDRTGSQMTNETDIGAAAQGGPGR